MLFVENENTERIFLSRYSLADLGAIRVVVLASMRKINFYANDLHIKFIMISSLGFDSNLMENAQTVFHSNFPFVIYLGEKFDPAFGQLKVVGTCYLV